MGPWIGQFPAVFALLRLQNHTDNLPDAPVLSNEKRFCFKLLYPALKIQRDLRCVSEAEAFWLEGGE